MAEIPETSSLLSNAKTDGLKAKSRDGDSLGHIKAFMVDKRSGQTEYAVLSLGGFLGAGKNSYPVPFSVLSYDPIGDDYVITIDRRQLEGGPSWASHAPNFDQAYADRVSSYYSMV